MKQSTRILILEDKATDADLAKRAIRHLLEDCEFQVAETRQEFVKGLEEFQPDVILSDYSLPHFDGMKALKLAQKQAPLTPLIIWTGSISEDVAVDCMKAGANTYVLKENFKRLGPAVLHALEERELLIARKQAEKELQNSEKRFRALMENGLDDISLLAADGTLLWESPSTVRNLGYPIGEFLGRNIFELMHPDDLEWTREVYAKLIQEPGSRQTGIFRLRHFDGTWHWVEAIAANMLHEAGVKAIVINYRDITERKQANLELQQKNDDLGLLNTINEAVIRGQDLDSIVELLAKELSRIFSTQGNIIYSTIFMLTSDKQSIRLQKYFFPTDVGHSIENLIGFSIPMIEIPIQEGGYFHQALTSRRSAITSEPKEIQNWIAEFTETKFLHPLARVAVRKLIPQIYKLLNIKSLIVIPLIAEEEMIGFWNVSGSSLFTANDLKRLENIGGQLTAVIQRQQANEKIHRSEEFLHSIQNALSAGIAILNEIGTIVQVNSAWREFGEDNGLMHPQYCIGLNYLEICDSAKGLHAEEASQVAQAIRAVIAGRISEARIEYPCHSPNMNRWFTLHITKFEDGDQVWVVLAHEDISERKRAEEALRESEEHYRAIFEGVQDAIFVESVDGKILMVNERACEMFGYTRTEFLTKTVPDLVPDGHLILTADSSGISTEPRETVNRRANGELFPIEISGRIQVINDETVLLVVVRDISERKRAEESLRAERKKAEKYLEIAGVMMLALDREGTVTLINRKGCEILGYSADEIIGKNWINTFLPEASKQELQEVFQKLISDDIQSSVYYENSVLTKNGEERLIAWHNTLLRDDQGRIISSLSSGEDITERKQAEVELRASEERFRQLANNIQEVFWITDAETGKEIYMSPAAETIWGGSIDNMMHEPDAFINSIFPQDQPAVLHFMDKEKNGEKVEMEYRIVRPDGSVRWIWDRAFPIFDESGKVKNIAGISADITERRASELALIKSQSRYRELFDNSPVSIWEEDFSLVKKRLDALQEHGVIDLEKHLSNHLEEMAELASCVRILDANKAALELYRIEHKEVLLQGLSKILSKDALSHFQQEILGLLSPLKKFTWEGPDQMVNGRQIEVLVTGSIPMGYEMDWAKVIVSVSDITERKRAEEEIRRRAEETSALLATSLALTSLDLKAILQTIGNSAKTLFAADGCRVFLMEPDGDSLRCVLALQENFAAFSDLRIKIGEGVTGAVAASGHAEIVNEMQNDPRAVQVPGTPDKEAEAIMFAPLKQRDRTIGVLSIRRAGEGRSFQPADLELLEAFAAMAASAVSNARLFEETERRLAELEALYDNGLAVSRLLKPSEIGNRIIQTFANHLAWHHVTIRLRKEDSDDLELVAFNLPQLKEEERTEAEQQFIARINKVGQGLSGWVLQTGKPFRTGNVHAYPQYVEMQAGIQSGLYMPLRVGERLIGVISVESEVPDAFTEQDERLLATLANQAAIAFENARLYQKVEQELLERKRAEVALHKSEALYRQAIEVAGAVPYYESYYDEGRLIKYEFIGEGIRQITGYGPEEFSAALWDSLVEEINLVEDLAGYSLEEGIQRVRTGKNPIWKCEHCIRARDGKIHWVFEAAVELRDENGTSYGSIGTYQDITERKRAEEALRVSETHYRELADSITDILFELDQDLHYTHWNKVFEIVTGISAKEAIGRSMQEIFGESEEQSRIKQIYEDVLKKHRPRTFETILTWNGEKRSFEVNAYPSARGISVVAKDVTERKRSEIIMQKRFELMEYSAHHTLSQLMQKTTDEVSVLTGSTIGFYHFVEADQNTLGMQTWSTNALQMFHVPISEGTHLSLDQAGAWAKAVRLRRPLVQNDYASLSKKRSLPLGHVPIEREIVIPIIRNERIMAVMGVGNKPQEYTPEDLEIAERLADYAWDITERKQMEITLAEERNQLAKRVEERTADLSRANSNLARALRVKDEFLANMSHELRTPLNAILGLSESLAEQIAGPLNEKQQKYIATIGESGHHLLALINDILDLAKIEAGQITLDINKVDIYSVCQASLRMIKQLAQKKNQEVKLEIEGDLGLMWADERRLKQMIVNLLSNAVKFTPEHGNIGLEVHGDREANKISITVWDNGIGIKEEDLKRLFQPFVQLDSGLARETTGTGLGLALVAEMARLHGGSVSVVSEPEKGSRFSILLPWEPALAMDSATRLRITGKFRAIKPDETSKPTILLVEDTREVVMMIQDYLELAGYKVVNAQDGVDALTQAKIARPDLILMDIQMPRMDGLETTRKLRSEPDFKHTPIVALTALAMPNDREKCLAAGMDEYISKPVNLKALVRIIQSCLLKGQEVSAQ